MYRFIGLLFISSLTIFGQNIDFPDPNFKDYLVSWGYMVGGTFHAYDANFDGEISIDEALAVPDLWVDQRGIQDITGIEFFTNLTILYVSYNPLMSLPDLSDLTKLERLYCSNNQLTSLPDLSDLTSLDFLECNSNQLTSLPDLSNLRSLDYLHCSGNQLTSLPDVSALTRLDVLECNSNQLRAYQISLRSRVWLICIARKIY